MKTSLLTILTLLILPLTTHADPYRSPLLWGPNNTAILLQSGFSMPGATGLAFGDSNPTTVAQAGSRGSLYARTGSSGGTLFQKQDDGSSTNWSMFSISSALTALTGDVSATGPGAVASTVNSIGGSSASNVHASELLANAATNANTASAIVRRDSSNNFSAGTITAGLSGNATNITGNLAFAQSPSYPINKTFFIDCTRSDSYTPDGTIMRPYKTAMAAVNKVISNADNSVSVPYRLDFAPGTCDEQITLNDSHLVYLIFEGHSQGVTISHPTALLSNANNSTLEALALNGMSFSGAVDIEGAVDGAGVFDAGLQATNVQVNGVLTLKNVIASFWQNCGFSTNIVVENNFVSEFMSSIQSAGSITHTVNLSDPVPFPGNPDSFIAISGGTMGASTITLGAASITQLKNAVRLGTGAGTVSVSGSLEVYSANVRSAVTVNSGGDLTNHAGFFTGALTIAGGGSIANADTFGGDFTASQAILAGSAVAATNARIIAKNGHLKSTQTTAPTAAPTANAGTGASCSVANATDSAGVISLTTTGVLSNSGAECDVTFNKAYNVAPICSFTPANSNAILDAVIQGVYFTSSTTKSTINFANTDAIGRAYSWNYQCIETQ